MAVTQVPGRRVAPGIYSQGGRTVYSANRPAARPVAKPKPVTPAATPAPTAPQPVAAAAPLPTASPEQQQFYANSLFGNLKQTDPQGSAMYKWRLNQGLADLEKQLSAKGQLDSGFAQEQRLNLINRLSAEEASRLEDARSTDANRLQLMMENEANRRQNVDFRGRDDIFKLLDMSLSQYQPGQVPQSVSQWMDLEKALGSAMASRGGGGGGRSGGGGAMPFIPAFPSGPNTAVSSQVKPLMDAANAAGRGDLFSQIATYLLK